MVLYCKKVAFFSSFLSRNLFGWANVVLLQPGLIYSLNIVYVYVISGWAINRSTIDFPLLTFASYY